MRTVSSTAIRTFEDLECWNRCRVLRLFVAKQVDQGRTLVNEAVKVLNGYMSYLKRAHRTRPATDNEQLITTVVELDV